MTMKTDRGSGEIIIRVIREIRVQSVMCGGFDGLCVLWCARVNLVNLAE